MKQFYIYYRLISLFAGFFAFFTVFMQTFVFGYEPIKGAISGAAEQIGKTPFRAYSNLTIYARLLTSPVGADTKNTENNIKYRIIPVPDKWFDTTPVRGKLPPLLYKKTGFVYKCHECHEDFKTPVKFFKPLGEHQNLIFDHGSNLNCLNCHHPDNRNAFLDNDGSEIPQNQPVKLCRKCHGTVSRDWDAGIHGRLNGYWDKSLGIQEKLSCNQCHDPHQPAFQSFTPMPPPVIRIKQLKEGSQHE